MPFRNKAKLESVFTRGQAPPHRPLLLMEPNYKFNDEKLKNSKSTKSNIKTEGKSASVPSDSKTKETPTPDVNSIDKKSYSDAKDKMPNPESIIRDKNVDDRKPSNEADESYSVTEQKAPRPAPMEENIVLGVALDGSKRTLPIEEGMDTTSLEVKELTKSSSVCCYLSHKRCMWEATKSPTERLFMDKYGRICLCLDEIVWKYALGGISSTMVWDLNKEQLLSSVPLASACSILVGCFSSSWGPVCS